VTAREVAEAVAEAVAVRVKLWAPAAKVELAEDSTSVWLYLPNGQTFEIKATETRPVS